MVKRKEDFELDSGLFDDLDATFSANSYFGDPTGDYAASLGGTPEPGLHLVMESPDLEKPMEQFYSIGKGWKVENGGKSVVNVDKPDKHGFGAQSNAGFLVKDMMVTAGAGDIEKGKEFFSTRDQYMTDIAFYAGLSYHMKRQDVTRTIQGVTKTSPVLLPKAFIGAGKTSAPAQTAGTSTTGSAPPLDIAALDKIIVSMAAGKTERELKQSAIKNDDIKANRDYMGKVVSGDVLKRLETDGKLTKFEDKYV